jgi:hypothetical protein
MVLCKLNAIASHQTLSEFQSISYDVLTAIAAALCRHWYRVDQEDLAINDGERCSKPVTVREKA